MLVELIKQELISIYPSIIYYTMLLFFILFTLLFIIKVSYKPLDVLEFVLLQTIFFIIIFF